ncbi:ABC transporter substrate-binding protein [Oceanobacillus neutriphilus]|uniref:HTH-type transcriptional regulator SgrR n=1 Tax=Oceanobacillus neutriphilus TaxID=531815 RepID=A0ABQ2NY41_9BACI|nr:ABC transporter substrate-binding protein [Oceanobacillus neutriphilus]GGP13262.1 HTH-type transcriptional regulator SgrR [Oceanobacillus neutriphilus]
MKYHKYASKLLDYFNPEHRMETTIADLAISFQCSERHTKTIIHHLADKQWITWQVSQGRGKKPAITLHFDKEIILLEQAKEWIEKENYQKGFTIVHQVSAAYKEKFRTWFQQQVGITQILSDNNASLDMLRYPFYPVLLCMDPLYASSRHDSHMIQQIFERLVVYHPETDTLEPRIAHHWENEAGKRWIFYLRKNVRFHHGRILHANDVKATILRFEKDSSIRKNLDRIQVINHTTLIFHLNKSDYLFPRLLAADRASIIPEDVMKEKGKLFSSSPIGCGPYQLTMYNKEKIQLERFENYYGLSPWLDKVEIITASEEFLSQQKHPLLLEAPDSSWVKKFKYEQGADFIILNSRKTGPLQNSDYRRNLCKAIFPPDFCLTDQGEVVAQSMLLEKSMTLPNKINRTADNLEQVTLKIAAQQIRKNANHYREAVILQRQLEHIGIYSEIDLLSKVEWQDTNILLDYDLFVGGVFLSDDYLLSALTFMESMSMPLYPLLPDSVQKEIQQKLTKIRQSRNSQQQWDLYFQLERDLKEQHFIVFLNHRGHRVYEAEDSLYENIQLNSNGRIDYRKVWKKPL